MAAALNRALTDALAADDRVVVFGEDVGTLGRVFRITDGLARPKRRYWSREAVTLTPGGPPPDQAVIRRPGRDVTLIGYGAMVATVLEAADAAAEEGRDVEVIDLRSLSPLDDATLAESVRRTGRAVVVHEAAGFGGYGAEVAARLTELCFYSLEAPVLRVTGFDIPYPPPHLEEFHLPGTDRILDAIDRLDW